MSHRLLQLIDQTACLDIFQVRVFSQNLMLSCLLKIEKPLTSMGKNSLGEVVSIKRVILTMNPTLNLWALSADY